MFHKDKKYLASTTEVLSLYIDLKKRKVTEFELKKVKLMNKFIQSNLNNFQSDNLLFTNKLKK